MIGDYTAQYILDYSNPIEESLFTNQCIGMRERYWILLRFVQVSALVYIIIIIQPHRWNTSEPRPKCLLIGSVRRNSGECVKRQPAADGVSWGSFYTRSCVAWSMSIQLRLAAAWAVIELTQTMCSRSRNQKLEPWFQSDHLPGTHFRRPSRCVVFPIALAGDSQGPETQEPSGE